MTAVSGAHFSLVAALVLALTSAVRLPRPARAGLTVAAMAAMVLVVHPSPSVVRAAAMGLVALLGVLLGRPHRAPAALGATVVVLLVADPWLAGELGFVLSVLATGALVLLGGPLADRWAGALGRPVATALALPVAAQLVCAPVILLLTPAVVPLRRPRERPGRTGRRARDRARAGGGLHRAVVVRRRPGARARRRSGVLVDRCRRARLPPRRPARRWRGCPDGRARPCSRWRGRACSGCSWSAAPCRTRQRQ